MRWLGGIGGAKCGGGWYDPYGTTEQTYLEQARQTVLGGARESLLVLLRSLLRHGPAEHRRCDGTSPSCWRWPAKSAAARSRCGGLQARQQPGHESRVFDFVGMMGVPRLLRVPGRGPGGVLLGSRTQRPGLPAKLGFYRHRQAGPANRRPGETLPATVHLEGANVQVLAVKGDPKSLLGLPQGELDALRAALLRPLGHTFRAQPRRPVELFNDGSWVIGKLRPAPAEVELDDHSQTVPPRDWRLGWKR